MKYLPYILILVAFALGWIISPGKKVDSDAFKKERESYQQRISDLQSQIAAQDAISEAIRERMTLDSLAYLDALKRKDARIAGLQYKIRLLDLTVATAHDLDSIREVYLVKLKGL